MRKILTVFLAGLMLLSLAACGSSSKDMVKIGEWEVEKEVTNVSIPTEELTIFNNALKTYEGDELTPLCYMGSQVVAGLNRMYLCRKTDGRKTSYCTVVVYTNLDSDSYIMAINDFNLSDVMECEIPEDAEVVKLGGWIITPDYKKVKMSDSAQQVFDRVMGLEDVHYIPMAYLGCRMDEEESIYAYMCHSNTSPSMPEDEIVMVYLTKTANGDCKIKTLVNIEIADFSFVSVLD